MKPALRLLLIGAWAFVAWRYGLKGDVVAVAWCSAMGGVQLGWLLGKEPPR